jgi:hypothetical protein
MRERERERESERERVVKRVRKSNVLMIFYGTRDLPCIYCRIFRIHF